MPIAVFSAKSLGEDFVRHLRNGIAHGHVKCLRIDTSTYVELTDSYQNKQTAYVLMPMSCFGQIREVYCEIESTFDNAKERM